MSDTGYVLVDGGPEPITDVKILSKKESKPTDYELVGKGLGFMGAWFIVTQRNLTCSVFNISTDQ